MLTEYCDVGCEQVLLAVSVLILDVTIIIVNNVIALMLNTAIFLMEFIGYPVITFSV